MTGERPPVDTRCFWCRVWLCHRCDGDPCAHTHVRLPSRLMDVPPETRGEPR